MDWDRLAWQYRLLVALYRRLRHEEPRPLGCPLCQACGFWHCSDPLHCAGMRWTTPAETPAGEGR